MVAGRRIDYKVIAQRKTYFYCERPVVDAIRMLVDKYEHHRRPRDLGSFRICFVGRRREPGSPAERLARSHAANPQRAALLRIELSADVGRTLVNVHLRVVLKQQPLLDDIRVHVLA